VQNKIVTAEQAPMKRRGCLFYGGILGLIFLVFLGITALVAVHYARKMLAAYTDTKPMPLPGSHMSQAQIAELNQRVDAFRQDVRAGRPTAPLVLSADDLNALIATEPSLDFLKGKLYVTMDDGHLNGQMSVAFQDLGVARFKGRYLNGSGTFNLSMQGGNPQLTAENLLIKGKPLPDAYMQRIRAQNLAQNINNDARASAALRHIQDIQIKDGKMIIVPK
jgi:hypothetical protein